MSEIYRVKTLSAAIELAQEFKASGQYNLFRGQAQNWEVQSSIARLLPDIDPEIENRYKRLFVFFDSHPALVKYKADVDWFWAVAQHYGFPTSYIDFTTNPEIAAYFATNSKANVPGKDAVIILLNEEKWSCYMQGLSDYFKRHEVIAPYIARINVDNLWRLQAQEGCFLFSIFHDIEKYYDFDKIVFPFKEPFKGLKSSQIYPKRKSELEMMLDQFFAMEENIKSSERWKKFMAEKKIPVSRLPSLNYDQFFKRKQKHPSWRSPEFKKWDYPLSESWQPHTKTVIVYLPFEMDAPVEKQTAALEMHLNTLFIKRKIDRQTHLKFYVRTDRRISKKELGLVNRSCSRIWDGTRNLPFANEEIISMLSRYVVIGMNKAVEGGETISFTGEELLLLQMSNNYGNHTKCQVSPSVILSAFRHDLDHVLSQLAPKVLSPEILLHINNPFLLFDFHLLLEAFKQEMICYQVLRQRFNDNPVIFFSPAQIERLGYA